MTAVLPGSVPWCSDANESVALPSSSALLTPVARVPQRASTPRASPWSDAPRQPCNEPGRWHATWFERGMHVTTATSPTPTFAHLHSLLAKFSSVMLITFDQVSPVPHLRARPMEIAMLGGDCSLSFFTSASSEKVAEALLEGTAHVTLQKDEVSITLGGHCTLTRDRAVMAPLFNKGHEAWFPQGLDNPELALLQFHPDEAEIWDTSGVKGLQLVASMAKALLTGIEVDHAGSHARVLLPRSSIDGKNVTH